MKSFKKVGASLLALSLSFATIGPSVVKADGQYKLNNNVSKYMNAYDAKARRGARGTYSAGTYNIYKKYGDMINISTSNGPGAWINPADNKGATSQAKKDLYILKVNGVNVRSGRGTSSRVIGMVNKGATFRGVVVGKWLKTEYKSRTAYIWAPYFEKASKTTAQKQYTRYIKRNVYARAGRYDSAKKYGVLRVGQKVVGTPVNSIWFKVNYKGNTAYLYSSTLSTRPVSIASNNHTSSSSQRKPSISKTSYSSLASKAVEVAKSKVGNRYIWGATGPYSFDCSGLVYYSYSQAGVRLNRTSRYQYNHGYSVSFNNMKPGDLMFFGRSQGSIYHVAMYVGNGRMVHASTPSRGVVNDTIYSNWVSRELYGVKRIAD